LKKEAPAIHGGLCLNKPPGMTSFQLVAKVKRLLGGVRVGHTGTLDPMASGVLPLCIGQATRVAQYLLSADKIYRFYCRLGIRTDTGDAEGRVIAERDYSQVTAEMVRSACREFLGPQEQIPPLYSAVKYKGRRAYQLARQGTAPPRRPRTITIYRLDMFDFSPPRVGFELHCSKGTYVRTLADDLGEELGCGAHVAELVRTHAGAFSLEDTITLEELRRVVASGRLEEVLITPDRLLAHLPEVWLREEAVSRIRSGRPVTCGMVIKVSPQGFAKGTAVRLKSLKGELLAIGEARQAAEYLSFAMPQEQIFRLRLVFQR